MDIYKKKTKNCRQTENELVEISFPVKSICVHFGSEDTGKIKNQASKFTEISRTKAVRKMIQRLIQQLQRHIKIQQ